MPILGSLFSLRYDVLRPQRWVGVTAFVIPASKCRSIVVNHVAAMLPTGEDRLCNVLLGSRDLHYPPSKAWGTLSQRQARLD